MGAEPADTASKRQSPCIAALTKVVTGSGDRTRTFLGSVHRSTDDSNELPFTPVSAFQRLLQPLADGLRELTDSPVSRLELHYHAGSPESLESCTAASHAAELLGIDVRSCAIPANTSGQVTDVMLTEIGMVHSNVQIDEDTEQHASALRWLRSNGGDPM